MKLLHRAGALALALLFLTGCLPCALAATTTTATIPVTVTMTGDTPPSTPTFTFVLAAGDPANPMPAVTRITINGAGSGSFGPITYDYPDDYTYQLYQISGNQTGYTYDATVYTVTVQVTSDEQGNLTATFYMRNSSNGSKPGTAAFTNSYKIKTDIPKTGYGE